MPHTHRWPDGRPPGVYCSGSLRNGEQCHQMLASQVGAGLYMIVRDRLVATVGDIQSIRCPICLTDNMVNPLSWQQARVIGLAAAIEYGSSVMDTTIFSGFGRTAVGA